MQIAIGAESFDTSTTKATGGQWDRVIAYFVRRRVRISVLVFVALVVEDVLIGVRPHAVTDIADPEAMIGVTLVFAGIAIRSWAAGILQKSRELTTAGPYQVIRNPLYVGSFLIMGGFSAIIDDVENIAFILGPIAGLYFLQVLHEERLLASLFGDRWHQYAQQVPRFLPRRVPTEPLAAWRTSSWLRNREYQALLSVLAGLAAIEVWRMA